MHANMSGDYLLIKMMFDAGVLDVRAFNRIRNRSKTKTLRTTRCKFAANQALSFKSIAHLVLPFSVFLPRPQQTCNGEAIVSPFPAH